MSRKVEILKENGFFFFLEDPQVLELLGEAMDQFATEKNKQHQNELLIDFCYKLGQRLDTNLPQMSIDSIVNLYEEGNL